MKSHPLVSAIMISGKTPAHQFLAERAIDSVLAQTYPNLELVIVNDSEYSLQRPDYRVREIKVPKGKVLGELRNIGLDVAKGQFVSQTDDDDWYHPERIERQMAFALNDSAVMLEYQIRYSFVTNCAIVHRDKHGIAGTILHPRTPGRYPPKSKGEDSDFWLRTFGPRHMLIRNKEQAGLYCRFFHGTDVNTWDEQHVMRNVAGHSNKWELSPEEQGLLLGVLDKYKRS